MQAEKSIGGLQWLSDNDWWYSKVRNIFYIICIILPYRDDSSVIASLSPLFVIEKDGFPFFHPILKFQLPQKCLNVHQFFLYFPDQRQDSQ